MRIVKYSLAQPPVFLASRRFIYAKFSSIICNNSQNLPPFCLFFSIFCSKILYCDGRIPCFYATLVSERKIPWDWRVNQ